MLGYMKLLSRLGGWPIAEYQARRHFLACASAAMLGVLALSSSQAGEATPPAQAASAAPELRHVARLLARHSPITIIAFGSSSTEGVGASTPAHAYPAQLEADLDALVPAGVTVVNRGIGGQDADDMLARLDRDVIAAKPDLVIWQTGTNDPLRKLPLDRFETETRDGIARMRAAGIDVVLMEPQDCRMMRATPGAFAYRDAVRRIGAEMAVPVVRRYDLIHRWLADGKVTEAQLMAPDGLHMADAGYERLAAEVAYELLADAGRKPAAR
ncbi:MAG TPA: GDSL-type esterase/lipase family protein [Aliidongia sp.]|nr:GDSL-type esterase/lipase family protein [Aliidongia sp.]